MPSETTQGATKAPKAHVMVVDDEPALRRSLARVLLAEGFDVMTAEDGAAALTLLSTARAVDVVLLDVMMPGPSGMEVLARIKEQHPEVEVVMMTAFGDIDTAVAAVRQGAYNFLTKPFGPTETVALALMQAAEHKRLVDRTRLLEQRLVEHERFGELIGRSSRMQDVYRIALGAAPTTSTVLILGENGTGKELVARAIHQHSLRSDRPLRAINCGAIPETLVETELFGSMRGAFTGAQDRPGLFELADKGTVFLDEIGDLPLSAQAKLLRALAEGEIKRVGATEPKTVDVRVIAATNVDLKERIASGRFREDLYYRLAVIPVHLPPLRQRKEDIPLLAYHFLHKYARRSGRDIKRIGVEALRLLREQPWPGNVRQLENAIEHAVVMTRGDSILPSDLPFGRDEAPAGEDGAPGDTRAFWGDTLSELPFTQAKEKAALAFERAYVERLLKRTSNNVSEAARQAGMDRSNFRRLMKKVRASADDGAGEDDEG
ncbi:sigma-54-dependent transcriptional regulator [Polyangium sorediatum]|uniref:Sigma-54 dependent transcriptional regulator n=1 Tax=Polyangium sorediatum TaxID=889274 RepID=A0ABT6P398_9BACT|nr:sigma-54 dependent transcriptional regulator [Polyangium sorediatum]MDI1435081.1 sigma-54 dependent transcriptional regulator [Polyangium sorediatum]